MSLPAPVAPAAGLSDQSLGLLVEELTAKLQAGMPVDVPAYVEEHPEHAERLRQLLPALRLLADLGRSAAAGISAGIPPAEMPQDLVGTLGDYRLVREVGRGGMGVVYEAEQLSLGRRVALKVLPFASTLDPRQLQRFRNEAHAAAQLHHTHIVPVHATGCERGVHFYAMQYVEGRTLAAVIAELRRQAGRDPLPGVSAGPERTGPYCPEAAQTRAGETTLGPGKPRSGERSLRSAGFFRTVAELGIQAAEALEHAHQLGIIHRDIKPANLMVEGEPGVSTPGIRLWVTDFGLAHVQSQAGLTLSGDLVGTLRYMSPEQALAKRVPVDHRTDIYSLGVTLYELLTLEPAFGGENRQELLRQIAFDEPKPPRRLNRAVPQELETIVGKALEKNPADRYATARELADDLERFLKDEPIRARRPTLLQRAWKWARRHKAAVWAAAMVFLLAALMAGLNGIWVAQKRAETEGAVLAVLGQARELQDKEKWPEARAAAQRAEALVQVGGGSNALRRQVQELVRDLEMVRRLEDARLRPMVSRINWHPDWEGCQAAYAEAFAWYGLDVERLDPRAAAERIRSRPIALQLAVALDAWAACRQYLGLPGVGQLVAVARAADPDRWRDRLRDALEGKDMSAPQELAAALPGEQVPPATAVLLALLCQKRGATEQAAEVLFKVRLRHPDDFWVNFELGSCLHESRPPRLEEAIRYYTAAVALRPESAAAHNELAVALTDRGKFAEAEAECREVLRLWADSPEAHVNLASALNKQRRWAEAEAECREALRLRPDCPEAHNNLSISLREQGKVAEAEKECRAALHLRPDFPEAHLNLGNALHRQGKLPEAEAEYREALRLRPDSPEAHTNLGAVLFVQGKVAEAEAEYRQALRLPPENPEAHYNLGRALQEQRKDAEAEAEYRAALRLRPDDPEAHVGLGNALWEQGKVAEAEGEYRRALRQRPAYPEAHDNLGNALYKQGKLPEAEAEYRAALRLQSDDPVTHTCLGIALGDQGKLPEAEAEFREALRLQSDYPEAHYNLGTVLNIHGKLGEAEKELRAALRQRPDYPEAHTNLGAALLGQGKVAEAEAECREALRRRPDDPEAHGNLGNAMAAQRRWTAAARSYAKAFALKPKAGRRTGGGEAL